MGQTGYRWMMGGLDAPAWMRGSALPGYMMGTSRDPGKIMGALFAEGRIGEDDFQGVWGGIRFYFGQKDKSLIRRHREDDPYDWGSDFGGASNTGSTTTTPPACSPISFPAVTIGNNCIVTD